jgi:hypothetical protein
MTKKQKELKCILEKYPAKDMNNNDQMAYSCIAQDSSGFQR